MLISSKFLAIERKAFREEDGLQTRLSGSGFAPPILDTR